MWNFSQSDIEELPVYIGQKWSTESLELTCWADDDSMNIEIVGSIVGAVRRKYQVDFEAVSFLIIYVQDCAKIADFWRKLFVLSLSRILLRYLKIVNTCY